MTMDLSPYMKDSVDRSEPWIYNLHGVLVHSGDVHGGHYFVLIKPEANGRWLKFDDDRVTHATEREVLEENFGGEMRMPDGQVAKPPPGQLAAKGANKRFTNAYMLVYIRESRAAEILAPVTENDTPAHLRGCISPLNIES
jgi:ubiquitin carboxyl-terminal hydrolase 7